VTSSPALSPIGHELLDDPGADPALVAASLGNIARANRWLGGAAAVRFGLARLLAGVPRGARLTLLDLGTGLGDLPRVARAWGARRGLHLDVVGCDRSPVAARLARDHGVPCAVACVGALPFAARSVDVVLVSQVAHHLAREAVVDLVRVADRTARLGVVVADLSRSRIAALGFGLAARALSFDAATTHDGLLSVQRGYAPAELRAILRSAGIDASVHRRPGYRLVAAWRAQGA
jgi:SAM-dependent methyltransferase